MDNHRGGFRAARNSFGHNLTPATSGPLAAIRLTLADLSAPGAATFSWTQTRLWLDIAPLLFGLLLLLLTAPAIRLFPGKRAGTEAWASRLPASLLVYTVAIWLLCVAAPVTGAQVADPLLSAGRYLLGAAPLYLIWADLCRRWPALERLTWQIGLPLQIVLALYVFGVIADSAPRLRRLRPTRLRETSTIPCRS